MNCLNFKMIQLKAFWPEVTKFFIMSLLFMVNRRCKLECCMQDNVKWQEEETCRKTLGHHANLGKFFTRMLLRIYSLKPEKKHLTMYTFAMQDVKIWFYVFFLSFFFFVTLFFIFLQFSFYGPQKSSIEILTTNSVFE